MKKLIVTAVILSMLTGLLPVFAAAADGSTRKTCDQDTDIYRSLSLTLLSPYVDKAIGDFYDEYMTYLPREDTWFYQILSIERPHPGDYSYIIKLEVLPYVGPHLSVGRDHITLKTDLSGKVMVEKFEHLESYELPPHYQDIIKKKLPGT